MLFDLYSKSGLKMLGTGECGCISACRYGMTKAERAKVTKLLKLKLANPNVSITKVKGVYVEDYNTPNAKEVYEESFFVCAKKGYDLRKLLVKLGKEFNHDSVFWIDSDGDRSELIGTNSTGYPGLNKVVKYKGHSFGADNQFMSKVKGRPFYFKQAETSDFEPGVIGMQGVLSELNKVL